MAIYIDSKDYIKQLIIRAKEAQKIADTYTQQEVDILIKAIAWEVVKDENIKEIAKLAVEESRLGNYESKYIKIAKKVRGALRDILNIKSIGIIERDNEKGLIKIAKPVGVIGAFIPYTNPEATPAIKAINAIKGRNAIILSPNPRTKKTNKYIVDLIRGVLKKYNAPQDLIISIEEPTLVISNELMKQCDLIIATGSEEVVKAAYSSGTPTFSVGAGNAVVVVDETADFKDAAHKIRLSKTFDYSTSCSAENSLIILEHIYTDFLMHLESEGGYLLSPREKIQLEKCMWVNGKINRTVVAQPAYKIAELANIDLPEGKEFLMVEETGIGCKYPYSGEKMCVVVALYKVKNLKDAIDKVNQITSYQGMGHSCGIHSTDINNILEFATNTKTARVMVRQPQCYANTGDWVNSMPFTMSLGCGTWGGSITTENISLKHYINTTSISIPIKPKIPDDKELFGEIMNIE